MILRLLKKLFLMKIIFNFILKRIKIKRQAEIDSMPKHAIKKKNILIEK